MGISSRMMLGLWDRLLAGGASLLPGRNVPKESAVAGAVGTEATAADCECHRLGRRNDGFFRMPLP